VRRHGKRCTPSCSCFIDPLDGTSTRRICGDTEHAARTIQRLRTEVQDRLDQASWPLRLVLSPRERRSSLRRTQRGHGKTSRPPRQPVLGVRIGSPGLQSFLRLLSEVRLGGGLDGALRTLKLSVRQMGSNAFQYFVPVEVRHRTGSRGKLAVLWGPRRTLGAIWRT